MSERNYGKRPSNFGAPNGGYGGRGGPKQFRPAYNNHNHNYPQVDVFSNDVPLGPGRHSANSNPPADYPGLFIYQSRLKNSGLKMGRVPVSSAY